MPGMVEVLPALLSKRHAFYILPNSMFSFAMLKKALFADETFVAKFAHHWRMCNCSVGQGTRCNRLCSTAGRSTRRKTATVSYVILCPCRWRRIGMQRQTCTHCVHSNVLAPPMQPCSPPAQQAILLRHLQIPVICNRSSNLAHIHCLSGHACRHHCHLSVFH